MEQKEMHSKVMDLFVDFLHRVLPTISQDYKVSKSKNGQIMFFDGESNFWINFRENSMDVVELWTIFKFNTPLKDKGEFNVLNAANAISSGFKTGRIFVNFDENTVIFSTWLFMDTPKSFMTSFMTFFYQNMTTLIDMHSIFVEKI